MAGMLLKKLYLLPIMIMAFMILSCYVIVG